MKLTRVIAIAVIAMSGGLGYVNAKALRDASEPSEFPPASYQGRQYVDSKGCVFIRAGIGGNVTWVPRVSRSRSQVCGFQPSLSARARAAEPVPSARPATTRTTTTVATAPARAVRPATVKPRPVYQSTTVRPTAVRPAAVRTTAPSRVRPVTTTYAAPAIRTTSQPTYAPATTARRVTSASACGGLSPVSARYMGTQAGGLAVRCGPQATPHHSGARSIAMAPVSRMPAATTYTAPQAYTTYAPTTYAPATHTGTTTQYGRAGYGGTGFTTRVGPNTRVAPRHVYSNQIASTQGVGIPDGYKRVWMDGRLSTQRTHQTFGGKGQMDLIWTRTIPRKLIVRKTGQVVTQHYPGLAYPYTSYDQQAQGGYHTGHHPVQQNGYESNNGYGSNMPVISSQGRAPARASAKARTVSRTVTTRAVTRASAPAVAASHRYVQAGVFTTRAQAQQAAQVVARTGVPTRLGSLTKGSNRYSLVLAGPFTSQAALNSALARVRSAGFGNATLRK